MNVSPQIASDNHRYVSFQRRNKVPTVLDTFTGKLKPIRYARGCHPRDIGGRRVLMICGHRKRRPKKGDTGFRAMVGSVDGGKATRLPKEKTLHDAYEIGKYWVSIAYRPDNPPFKFVNWRTGEKRTVGNPYNGRDLDSRNLKPLKLKKFTPDPKGYPDPFPPPYDPLALCRGENVVVSEWKHELRLWWSRSRSVRLSKGGFMYDDCEWYESIRIGPEAVSWSKGPTVHAYNYRSGRRFDRRFPKPGARITPMRDGVVVAEKIKNVTKFRHIFRIKFYRW